MQIIARQMARRFRAPVSARATLTESPPMQPKKIGRRRSAGRMTYVR